MTSTLNINQTWIFLDLDVEPPKNYLYLAVKFTRKTLNYKHKCKALMLSVVYLQDVSIKSMFQIIYMYIKHVMFKDIYMDNTRCLHEFT